MTSSKLGLKLFFQNPEEIDAEAAIPVFHAWIRDGALPGELMIDVANYSHVPNGPGVMLICDGVHYAVDLSGGRPGLRFARKRKGLEGALEDRLTDALASTLEAATLLEQALGWRIDTREIEVSIPDRLNAPNTPETFQTLEPGLRAFLAEVYDQEVELTHRADPKAPFTVDARVPQAPTKEALLAAL